MCFHYVCIPVVLFLWLRFIHSWNSSKFSPMEETNSQKQRNKIPLQKIHMIFLDRAKHFKNLISVKIFCRNQQYRVCKLEWQGRTGETLSKLKLYVGKLIYSFWHYFVHFKQINRVTWTTTQYLYWKHDYYSTRHSIYQILVTF